MIRKPLQVCQPIETTKDSLKMTTESQIS